MLRLVTIGEMRMLFHDGVYGVLIEKPKAHAIFKEQMKANYPEVGVSVDLENEDNYVLKIPHSLWDAFDTYTDIRNE